MFNDFKCYLIVEKLHKVALRNKKTCDMSQFGKKAENIKRKVRSIDATYF